MRSSDDPKHLTLGRQTAETHPRQAASFISQIFFTWCLPLVRLQRQLDVNDVWPLEATNKAETNTAAFAAAFERSQSVVWAGLSTFGGLYILSGFLSLNLRFLDLVGPIVLQRVSFERLFGVMLHYCNRASAFGTGLKGVLFQKVLSKASYTQANVPDLANVYTADMDALIWASSALHNLWILPTQVVLISYMLYNEIGVAAFAGMGVIVLSLLVGAYISKIQSTAYAKFSQARDVRMKAVKETFGSILYIKLHALEAKYHEKIQSLQLAHVWTLMFNGAISIFCFWAAPLFVSMASFAVPTDGLDRHLDKSCIISMEGGFFAWGDHDATPTLKNICLTISRGELVVIHGRVGSGKSSLCLAILGEMIQTQGTTALHGTIAYCSQEPWIQQMMIRDNILFGSPFDSEKYSRVVEACCLLVDFKALQHGDLTAAGSKGCNLSGGQKARIGLARACYSDADIIILDSPLAAIDSVVQKEIINKCIGNLLKTKTVILVTHNPEIIISRSLNQLFELDDGKVLATRPENPMDTLLERAIGRVDSSVYSSFFAACGGSPTVVMICIAQTLWQVFQIASDVWLSHWTSTSTSVEETAFYIEIYSALCFGCVLMVLLRAFLIMLSGWKASRTLFYNMAASLLGTSMPFFDKNPMGRIVNRFAEDMATIDTRLAYTYSGFVAMLFPVVGSLLTAMVVIRWGSLLFIPIIYLYVSLSLFYLQPSRELSRLINVTNSPVLSFLDEVSFSFEPMESNI
ncbi:hypothetical protein Ae201684P_001735 [Aphanomyces euteiches]|nr:hypothetical protein Ae201684P_001735 [Aphanomyces euteiches]